MDERFASFGIIDSIGDKDVVLFLWCLVLESTNSWKLYKHYYYFKRFNRWIKHELIIRLISFHESRFAKWCKIQQLQLLLESIFRSIYCYTLYHSERQPIHLQTINAKECKELCYYLNGCKLLSIKTRLYQKQTCSIQWYRLLSV